MTLDHVAATQPKRSMPWRPLTQPVSAVCIASFEGTRNSDLSLSLGDRLYVAEEDGAWYRGWQRSNQDLTAGEKDRQIGKSLLGTFPKCNVRVLKGLGTDFATDCRVNGHEFDYADGDRAKPKARAPASQPTDVHPDTLLDDVTLWLSDWQPERLRRLISSRAYDKVSELHSLVESLGRDKQVLQRDRLTRRERSLLTEQCARRLAHANARFDDQVIVRDHRENGRLMTFQDDMVHVLETQLGTPVQAKTLPASNAKQRLKHLLVSLDKLEGSVTDATTLHMHICAKTGTSGVKALSETVDVALTSQDSNDATETAQVIARSLFVNLPSAEVDGLPVYLACTLSREEYCRGSEPQLCRNASVASFQKLPDAISHDEGEGSHARPSTAASLRSRFQRQNTVPDRKRSIEPHMPAKKVRRAFAWAAYELQSALGSTGPCKDNMQFWQPCDSGDQADSLAPEALNLISRHKDAGYRRLDSSLNFDLTLQMFVHDDAKLLIDQNHSLLNDADQIYSRSMVGTDVRNDVYVTLREPWLPQRGLLAHPLTSSVPLKTETNLQNLQVTLEVRASDGTRLEDAINTASNAAVHTAFRTHATVRGDSWDQTIRISLAPGQERDAHLVMSIADGPMFPFALAWLPLWDRSTGFTYDGEHRLSLWDYSEHTVNQIDGRAAYQALGPDVDRSQDSCRSMSAIIVDTQLLSTTAAQDATVASVLDQSAKDDLVGVLGRFHLVPEAELVKFFVPLLAAFDLMLDGLVGQTTVSHKDGVKAIFKCLANLYNLVRDYRYPGLRASLEDHIEKQTVSVSSRTALMNVFGAYLASPFDGRSGRELRSAIKITEFLIMSTSQRGNELRSTSEAQLLQNVLVELFDDLTVLLANTNQLALPTQVLILQYLVTWLEKAMPMLGAQQTLDIAVTAIDACDSSRDQLRLQKLTLISQLITSDAFAASDAQERLAAQSEQWLSPYWPRADQTKNIAAVRICCTVLKNQLPHLDDHKRQHYLRQLFSAYHAIASDASETIPNIPGKKVTAPFPASLPFQTMPQQPEQDYDEALVEMVTLIGNILQLSLSHGANMSRVANLDPDSVRVMLDALSSIHQNKAYPQSWLTLHAMFIKCQIVAMEWALDFMISDLPDAKESLDVDDVISFNDLIWSQWFNLMSLMATSENVALECHSEYKQKVIMSISGDQRCTVASLLGRAWSTLGWDCDEHDRETYGLERLGGYQVHFTSSLVHPLIAVGLSSNSNLRDTAIEILHSMLIGEWQLSASLDLVQSSFVDALDSAFRTSILGATQASALIDALRISFSSLDMPQTAELHAAVITLLDRMTELVDLLLRSHATTTYSIAALDDQVELLDCLKTLGNSETYLRRIHDLATVRAEAKDCPGAALTLHLHVEHNKSAYAIHDYLAASSTLGLPAQSVAQRQECLLRRISGLYTDGQNWDMALRTLETRSQNMHHTFDVIGLAAIHKEQAEIYERLGQGSALSMPRYFKVVFGASAVPEKLANKMFIYEADSEEDTDKFSRRIRYAFPQATVVQPGSPVPKNVDVQTVLRITNVNINKEHAHAVNHQSGVSPFFRLYHLTASPSVFSTSARQERPGQSTLAAAVTKTIYYTRTSFPTLLGRSEVMSLDEVVLSPLQAAIDRTYRKTMEIAEASSSTSLTQAARREELLRMIRTSIDPAPDSVANYRTLIENEQLASDEDEGDSIETDATGGKSDLIAMLAIALEEHARALEHAIQTLTNRGPNSRDEMRDKYEVTFQPELRAMYPSGMWRAESQLWRTPELVNEHVLLDDAAPTDQIDVESDSESRPRWRRRSSSIRTRLSFLGLGKPSA